MDCGYDEPMHGYQADDARRHSETTADWLRRLFPDMQVNNGEPKSVILTGVRPPKKPTDGDA